MSSTDWRHRRALDALLDQVLEIPAAERATWLAALRGRAPALAVELAALLDEDAAAERTGFLATPIAWSYRAGPPDVSSSR